MSLFPVKGDRPQGGHGAGLLKLFTQFEDVRNHVGRDDVRQIHRRSLGRRSEQQHETVQWGSRRGGARHNHRLPEGDLVDPASRKAVTAAREGAQRELRLVLRN
jgi:hypothetical protein